MRNIKQRINKSVFMLFSLLLFFYALVAITGEAYAAQITNRSLSVSSSQPGVTATWTYKMSLSRITPVQSIRFQMCTTAIGACTVPTGWTNAGSSSGGSVGIGNGFSGDKSMSDSLAVKSSTNVTLPSVTPSSVVFNTVTNPTTTATYFVRITTYSDATYTTLIDDGVVASSTATQIDLTTKVNEVLNFSVSASASAPGSNCTPLGGTSALTLGDINGVLNSSTAYDAHSYFRVNTNAAGGVNVYYSGDTLKTGGAINTIAAIGSSSSVSSPGIAQFGLGLDSADTQGSNGYSMTNLLPVTPYDQGSGVLGTASTKFAFDTGSLTSPVSIASVVNSTVSCDTGSVRYVSNISTTTKPGIYKTSISYIAVPTF